jgi:hypothetical protein
MTTKADYSADEWNTLVAMPAVVGLAVILAESSQPRGRKEEVAALVAGTVAAAAEYAGNELVQAVLPDAKAAVESDEVAAYGKAKQTAKALEVAVTWCEKVNAILDKKSSFLEADGYKRFVLTAGLKVALTSADAEYLGIGGQKLSHGERKTLLKLVDVLEVDYEY